MAQACLVPEDQNQALTTTPATDVKISSPYPPTWVSVDAEPSVDRPVSESTDRQAPESDVPSEIQPGLVQGGWGASL